MILYLDTSAIVKRYFEEPESTALLSEWKKAAEIVTSAVAYAETLAAFYRKKREASIEEGVFGKILHDFRLDWRSFIRVDVTDELNGTLDRMIEKYPLRGFDAIHLSSAVLVKKNLPEEFLFACFDQRLARAAWEAGLETFPST